MLCQSYLQEIVWIELLCSHYTQGNVQKWKDSIREKTT